MLCLVRWFHYTNLELILYRILVKENCYIFASISEKWTDNYMSIGKADQILNFKYQSNEFVLVTLFCSCESSAFLFINIFTSNCSSPSDLFHFSYTSTGEEVVRVFHHYDAKELCWLLNVLLCLLLRSRSVIYYFSSKICYSKPCCWYAMSNPLELVTFGDIPCAISCVSVHEIILFRITKRGKIFIDLCRNSFVSCISFHREKIGQFL